MLIFIPVGPDHVGPGGGADRASVLSGKRRVSPGFFDCKSDAVCFVDGLRITNHGLPRADNSGRAFKLESVRKGIGITERSPSLAGQDVLVLCVKLP